MCVFKIENYEEKNENKEAETHSNIQKKNSVKIKFSSIHPSEELNMIHRKKEINQNNACEKRIIFECVSVCVSFVNVSAGMKLAL